MSETPENQAPQKTITLPITGNTVEFKEYLTHKEDSTIQSHRLRLASVMKIDSKQAKKLEKGEIEDDNGQKLQALAENSGLILDIQHAMILGYAKLNEQPMNQDMLDEMPKPDYDKLSSAVTEWHGYVEEKKY